MFTEAEAGIEGSPTSGQTRTQTLTFTLTPRVEDTVTDTNGATTTVHGGLDVAGHLEAAEENPALPPLPGR